MQEYPSVGSHYDFDIYSLIEPVHLVQQFDQNSLDFSIRPCLCSESPSRNCVYFVYEDDRRRILSGHSENITNHSRTFSQVFLNEFRANHSYKGGLLYNKDNYSSMMSDCFSHHGFACSRRSVHQNAYSLIKNTSRRVNSYLLVQLELSQREFYRFSDFLLLNI